jgi:hypothetical protein
LTGLSPIANVHGIGGDANFLPDFAAHLEVFRDLTEVPDKLVGRRRAIKCGILRYEIAVGLCRGTDRIHRGIPG